MKQLMLALLFWIAIDTNAQNTGRLTYTLDFEPIGTDYHFYADAFVGKDSFGLRTRSLPGYTMRLLQTDSVVVKGTQVSGVVTILNMRCRFEGYATADSVRLALISSKSKRTIGLIASSRQPLITYSMKEMATDMIALTRRHIYDTTLLNSKEWNSFVATINQSSGFLQDDLELTALVNQSARGLNFTHYNLGKMKAGQFESFLENSYQSPTPATLQAINPQTALLTINGFGGNGASLEQYMQEVIAKGYQNLIIDLRQNSGGGAGAVLALGKYLTDRPQTAGALLTNSWFKNHQGLPTAADYKNFAIFSGGSTVDLIKSFTQNEGIILQAQPAAQTFGGKLYILTSPITGSACEPFVYGMKYFKRATIVGTRTAGAMLSKIPFKMNHGFVLYLPVTDYYTIDGERLDKKGVEPNIPTTNEDALQKALSLIQ
jgi:hypothetical protein